MTQSQIIIILVVIGGVITLQFFQGRKINLLLMKKYVQGFEKNLRIKDKTYVWIGGYAGFRAHYELNDSAIKKLELTLTLLPRQSLLYFPISLLTRKHDRLYIVLRSKVRINTDVHIIKKYYYFLGPDIDEAKELEKGEVVLGESRFLTMYKNLKDLDKLMELAKKTFNPSRLRHIGLVKSTNILFALVKPDPDETPREVKKLIENFKNIVIHV